MPGEVCVCWREVESGEQYRPPGRDAARSGLKEVEGLITQEGRAGNQGKRSKSPGAGLIQGCNTAFLSRCPGFSAYTWFQIADQAHTMDDCRLGHNKALLGSRQWNQEHRRHRRERALPHAYV